MYGSRGSQRRPNGAPMYPNQHGISQDRQSQMSGPHQFGQPHPGPSPLDSLNDLPQHDEHFSGPRLPGNPAMPGEDGVNENMGRPSGNNNLPETPFIPRHNEHRTPSLSIHSVNNYMNPQPAGTPYLGHGNSHTPFSSGSELRSRSQSLAPGGGHEPDYHQFARPHHAGTYPYPRGGLLFQDQTGDMQNSGPQGGTANHSEFVHLSESMQQFCGNIVTSNNALTAQVQSLQGEMQSLKGEMAQLREEYESDHHSSHVSRPVQYLSVLE
ncbi:hypothetical protein EV702DRAFT_1043208 [Suillus placidus]|uniref:Uncharacterized protein n=1 Tax=Suillus placidus TaxID=48579 RepID=A0A9P7D5P5_9AGAM|nr:hypothetical protein EV702DRAFT_1043208 [Suillus placidus]